MSHRNSRHRSCIDSDPYTKEKRNRNRSARKEYRPNHEYRVPQEDKFHCLNCSLIVVTDPSFSGVNNRNHCPYCLWSKHVDRDKPGDRKADCYARMKPIGLTGKKTIKKYGGSQVGELMLIHQCTGCGKISINRIAADDSPGSLINLFRESQLMGVDQLKNLAESGIQPLLAGDLTTVFSQLFGWQTILDEFNVQPNPANCVKKVVEVFNFE